MRRKSILVGACIALVSLTCTEPSESAQTPRVQVDQKGDFLLIGNTLGHDCAAGTPVPVVGDVVSCGLNTIDNAPDVFWRSDSPMVGQAEANNTITVAQARSTAILTIPPMATVTHAFLYWGATIMGGDMTATLDRPGGFSQDITAMQMYTSSNNSYQGVADVTSIVQANGPGAYRVSGVNAANLVDLSSDANFAGWWMVVFYQLNTEPPRNLALFDGLDNVSSGAPQNLTLSGFSVPPAFTNAKLGIVTFEGDNTYNGDSFSFGPAPALTDGNNPWNNFFNGTHSFLGTPVSTMGDLPQLTGGPQSMSGIDIDVVDVTSKLMAGQTSVPISATSTGDNYYLAGFVTSIPTFMPDFSTSEKTAVDVNGGALLPGDVVEYTVISTNTGNDTSINTVLTDPLPMGVTYVPGSTQITAGANTGTKTDMTGDDQCEYDGGTRTITCRLGTMANAANGGTMLVGETTTVKFHVTIDATASGTISNQAIISAAGLLGAPADDTLTDGNGAGNGGQPPTSIVVDQCGTDADCPGGQRCDAAPDPNQCIPAVCGDGIPDVGETCDDGNMFDGDGCDSNCTMTSCGNGIVTMGEACDDGNMFDGDGCDSNCTMTSCGNGIVTMGETCDDANIDNTDTCLNTCAVASCGDGFVQAGVETCDDGNTSNTDACLNTCAVASCGDGFVQAGVETCDDGNTSNTDACLTTCVAASCGDGFVHAGVEACDDANMDNSDGCTNVCASSTCGDGFVQTGFETCDDANMDNTDACLNTCLVAFCGDGFVQTGVETCDDTNMDNTDACLTTCVAASCGDGFVHAGVEACDDGNTMNGDGCSDTCQIESSSCPEGSPCNDNDLCTKTDTCQAGVCTGADPVVCNPLDDCHEAGTCNPATGQCSSLAKPDGSLCAAGKCVNATCVQQCESAADCRPDPAFFDCVDRRCIPRTEGPLSATPACACSLPGNTAPRSPTALLLVALSAFLARRKRSVPHRP